MPIVAVAGAIAGATALATVGATALGVFGTIGAIGGIVSGIGAVTGNKDLMKIGAIAGLAGGVGAFASNQGWLASASAADTAAAGTQGGAIDALKNTASGAEVVSPTAGLTQQANAFNEANGLFNAETTNVLGADGGGATGGLVESASTMQAQVNPLITEASGAGLATTDPSSALAVNGADLQSDLYSMSGQKAGGGILDTLKGFGKWAEDNKQLAAIGANFIGGAFDDEKAARSELYRTRAELEKKQFAQGSDVPKLGLTLQKKPSIFKPTAPTYSPVRSLYNA